MSAVAFTDQQLESWSEHTHQSGLTYPDCWQCRGRSLAIAVLDARMALRRIKEELDHFVTPVVLEPSMSGETQKPSRLEIKEGLTIDEVVTNERRKLDEPMECSEQCHANGAPFHDSDCPANETTRIHAYGLAIARVILEGCATIAHNEVEFAIRNVGNVSNGRLSAAEDIEEAIRAWIP